MIDNIILASSSPRRKQLLEMIGFSGFKTIPANMQEIVPKNIDNPEEIVMYLAKCKATEVADKYQLDALIIAADTIVLIDDKILGKPKSNEEAFKMLRLLSDKYHFVYTGICIYYRNSFCTEFEKTKVHFRDLTDEEIRAYIESGEPMDKAGAYGIQGKGSVFVSSINGDFYNVMGLPLCRLNNLLKKFGVSVL